MKIKIRIYIRKQRSNNGRKYFRQSVKIFNLGKLFVNLILCITEITTNDGMLFDINYSHYFTVAVLATVKNDIK